MKLITLAQAKAHLRAESTAVEDDQIEEFVEAASAAVVNYLKSGADAFLNTAGLPEELTDTSGDVLEYIAPDVVKAATKILVGALFRNRDSKDPAADGWRDGYLPPAVTALLYPLRDPALA
jgi:hypothetical protein